MPSPIKLEHCLWLHGAHAADPLCAPLIKELHRRNIRTADLTQGLENIRTLLSKTDAHVIILFMPPKDWQRIYPLFKDRKNFSVVLVDWWLSPFWFTRNAEYVFYTLYSGIAVRLGEATFCNDYFPPFWSPPESTSIYELACAAIRPAALLAQPFLDRQKKKQRESDNLNPERMIFLPFCFDAEGLPLKTEQPVYDFGNLGATCGYWMMRDPFASARYNFVNLYADRKKLADSVIRYENNPFKVVDRRRGRFTWGAYCTAVAQCRFTMVTGGLPESCVPKYLEHVCLGTPMVGSLLPYEYPWLDQCLFPIDILPLTPQEIKVRLLEALEHQPRLRQNCLNLRDRLLKQYSASSIFDLAQDQINGKSIPHQYVKRDIKAEQIAKRTAIVGPT